jgi:hypothetical protein
MLHRFFCTSDILVMLYPMWLAAFPNRDPISRITCAPKKNKQHGKRAGSLARYNTGVMDRDGYVANEVI